MKTTKDEDIALSYIFKEYNFNSKMRSKFYEYFDKLTTKEDFDFSAIDISLKL